MKTKLHDVIGDVDSASAAAVPGQQGRNYSLGLGGLSLPP